MHLPDYLQSYYEKASKLLDKVGHIEFSGSVYQIQVSDPGFEEDAWAFLQFNDNGELKDCFCSCEHEDVSQCEHIVAAYLRIFNSTNKPLHERFQNSFWNHICALFSFEYGYHVDSLTKKGEGQYLLQDKFRVKGLTKKGKNILKEIINHPREETEETSLKFSNLTDEELELWREGRPSAQLCYELSFWNDFAKWMMQLQEEKQKYQVNYKYDADSVPNRIDVKFEDVEFSFSISREDLIALVPFIKTIDSPLKVVDVEADHIANIEFDKKSRTFVVKSKTDHIEELSGVDLVNWIYVPDDGFHPKKSEFLKKRQVIPQGEIPNFLDKHYQMINANSKGFSLNSEYHEVKYVLSIDDYWNLRISAYLFKPGDLDQAQSFGNWIFLKDKFYKIEELKFQQLHYTVNEKEMNEFIAKNRSWLNQHQGFKTHLGSLEGQLSFNVSADGSLTFLAEFEDESMGSRQHDFGSWIWIEGCGFYTKVSSVHHEINLKPGIALDKDQIPQFIRTNREELKYVPGFFSEKLPIKKIGLIVSLTDEDRIWIQPRYEYRKGYDSDTVWIFEDFTYVKDEGFFQLPAGMQLPVPFQEPGYLAFDEIAPFISNELSRLQEKYTVVVDPRLYVPNYLLLSLAFVVEKSRGRYRLKLSYKTDKGRIDLPIIWGAMHQKHRFLFSEAGVLDLHHSRFDWIRRLSKKDVDQKSNTVTLNTMDLIKLNIFDPIEIDSKKKKDADAALKFLEQINALEVPNPPDLTGLKSSLRPYQQKGVDWLWFLYTHGLSGLLCDDMGLGKTHQAMALMAAIDNQTSNSAHRFIIICPTSVIFHWEDKLKGHLPHLKVCIFYGTGRKLSEDYDILLTSYGIWRIDAATLRMIPFDLAIMDEIQVAKNENSRLHASLLRLDASMRLGMTGTPIENNLKELKSLFDIVLPNYMPGPKEYKELFITPIEKTNDHERKKILNQYIHPFLLRRKKEQVLTDLPEKVEEVYHCLLLHEQETLYRKVLEQSRQRILNEVANDSTPIPYVHVFAILSSLKQICDHPAVYLKCPEAYKEHRSGKWDLFLELLSEARDSRQKVVVFSQYLAMLDIIENYLSESGIGFASIRGATTDRGEQLRRFHADDNCEVFVGSLQASGLGVDLTVASVVIHYDRWWNAARENQATDRVHRIGQQKNVQVFKLVTKGTFEERIDEMIQSKGELMEEVVGSDDQNVIKYLDRQQIIELLSFGDTHGSPN